MTADYNFDSELTTAQSAAHRAGDAVMGLFKGKYDVHEKSKNNPVTTADLEANRIIRETISGAFPGDGWLSEEDQDSSRRLGLSRVWVVDPIDGTREFIDGIPQFAISIAFVVNGVPKVSVVFNPAENQFYKASVGRGAFLNDEVIHVTPRDAIDGALLLVVHFLTVETDARFPELHLQRPCNAAALGNGWVKLNCRTTAPGSSSARVRPARAAESGRSSGTPG